MGAIRNAVAGMGKMNLDAVLRGVTPFMLAEVAVIFLLVLFPSIARAPRRWLAA